MSINKISHLILLLFSVSIFAQYGNSPYGNSQYGNSSRLGMQNNYPTSSKPSQEDIEKSKTERIDKYMEKLKNELSLDELQFIAIHNEILSNIKKIDIIMKKEKAEDEKAKEINYSTEELEKNINLYLSDDQKEKYKIMKAERMTKKKDKDKNQ